MEIIDKLRIRGYWNQFIEYQIEQRLIPASQLTYLIRFVDEERYLELMDRMAYLNVIGSPRLIKINKKGTDRKREVFVYNDDEKILLKMISFLLREYDDLFCNNLFSFRKNRSVKTAIYEITKKIDVYNCYSYKIDIHDYFNSINAVEMIDIVKKKMPTEIKFHEFLSKLLLNQTVICENGKKDVEEKGIMAGMPFSGFLANMYLSDLDEVFQGAQIPYARYSDDIICFADSKEKIVEYESLIKAFLTDKGLSINLKKEKRTVPKEKIEFLGFGFGNGDIQVSDITLEKLKAKIKRRATSLYRWKIRNNVSDEKAIQIFIKFLNKKFYYNSDNGEITWCRWYFPVLSTDEQLVLIDDYNVACIRYLVTGKYGKKNYNLRYEQIKLYGYKSLVNNFWRFKKGKYEIGNSR